MRGFSDLAIGDITTLESARERRWLAYRAMYASQCMDAVERELVREGLAGHPSPGEGLEAMAVLGEFLQFSDWLCLQPRDKALMILRGLEFERFFQASLSASEAHSASRQSAMLSAPGLRTLCLAGSGGSGALQATGIAAEAGPGEIVLCRLEGWPNPPGEFLEAIAEAVRDNSPLVFLVTEDCRAPGLQRRSMDDSPQCPQSEEFGIGITRVDGRCPHGCRNSLASVFGMARGGGGPALVVMSVETPLDPVREGPRPVSVGSQPSEGPASSFRASLLRDGVMEKDLQDLEERTAASVREALARVRSQAGALPGAGHRAPRPRVAVPEERGAGEPSLTMVDALRAVLAHHLETDLRVTLLGQDIEDPAGDIFGLTRGLSTRFPDRVANAPRAPLAESVIVGKCFGRALAGGRPVALIQFAEFLPSMFYRIAPPLDGPWDTGNGGCPVIVMACCGGCRPWPPPCHAQAVETALAHIPGIRVVSPSRAEDAAGLLRAAFAADQPVIFLYPRGALNDRLGMAPPDVERQFVPIGAARRLRPGRDLTLVSWGGTVGICERTTQHLELRGASADLIDMRSLQPWDRDMVLTSAQRTRRLLVVHEDVLSLSLAGEIISAALQEAGPGLQARRINWTDIACRENPGGARHLRSAESHLLRVAESLLSETVSSAS